MDTKILAGISAAAIGAGCFLIGTVAGLAAARRGCGDCYILKRCYDADWTEEFNNEPKDDGSSREYDPDKEAEIAKMMAYSSLADMYNSSDNTEERVHIRSQLNKMLDTTYGLQSTPEDQERFKEEISKKIIETRPVSDGIEVMDVEAYLQGLEGYTQTTLVWFEDDETMIDNRDEMIPMQEWESAIGADKEKLATLFGQLSNDKDVVYIRNRNLMYEYEVIREHSSYAKSVLGVGPEDAEYDEALKFFGIEEKGQEQ